MTTVFVYESLCALGLGQDPSDPAHSLYREGRAMRDAVAVDFRQAAGVETVTVLDRCPPDEEATRFEALAAAADWTLVIAPELGGELLARCRTVERVGGRLLGPAPASVALASSKLALARVWEQEGIPTPRTRTWAEWHREPPRLPAVCKPDDGAGSTATFRLDGPADLDRALALARGEGYAPESLLLQDYAAGQPASVAFLAGPAGLFPLLPASQVISEDGRFRYQGGKLPLEPDLAARAEALGRRALGPFGELRGYVGVDLVLGPAADGSDDRALEVNPRLTTSYVGLRALAGFNLAEAMLRVARGERAADFSWNPGSIRFFPDGTARAAPLSDVPG